MKKRILFSACALAACFVACTNDDFQTEKSNMVIDEAGEVIGADLVSSGMKMNVSTGDATTRLNGNGWEAADEVGLAWYRYKAAIDKEQLRSDWENGSGWATDNNLYANHLFEFQSNGIWETHADVYQGAYFCYWPFERLGSASKIKVVEPNKAAQTKDFDEDRLENAFWLSAQDFIEQLDVQDLVLQKDFVLAPMVNTLGVNAIPAGKLTESEYLKGMIIKEMRINAGGTNNDVFIPSATLTPRYIPKAVYDMYGNLNKEETLVDLDEQATGNYDRSTKWYLTTTGVTNLTYLRTAIDNSDFNLNKTNTLRAFAFPLQKGVTYAQYQYPSVSIDVWSQVGEWKLGTFNISHSQEENAQLTERLKMMFEANPTNAAATWVKNIWGEPGEYQYAVEGMDASLTVHNFTPSTTILYGVDQWNDLVQLIDELDKAGKKFTNNKVTFTVASTNGVTFTNEIRTPENVQIVLKTGDNKIYIDGVVEWPKNLITDEETANIEVNKGATLKVGIDRDGVVNLVANSIVNNGTIMAGAEASISTDDTTNGLDSKLDNSNGTVIVEFGAWVYPAEGKDGVIAFEVSDNSEKTMGEINTLITLPTTVPQVNYAQVNTLILKDNVVLDLNAVAQPATEDDRYFEGSDAVMLSSLKDIDIWMRGATIVSKDLSAQTLVNNIVVEEGENTITDIRPQGDITIEGDKDGVLNITSEIPQLPYDDGTPWSMVDGKNIYNKGTLNVNETVTTTIFDNAVGTVNVENGETLYYTTQYIQGGHAHGTVEKTPTPADPTATLAANVQTTFNAYAAALKATSIDEVLEDLNGKLAELPNHKTDWNSAMFYYALDEYLQAKGQTGLVVNGTPTAVSIATIELFETLSGLELTVE